MPSPEGGNRMHANRLFIILAYLAMTLVFISIYVYAKMSLGEGKFQCCVWCHMHNSVTFPILRHILGYTSVEQLHH